MPGCGGTGVLGARAAREAKALLGRAPTRNARRRLVGTASAARFLVVEPATAHDRFHAVSPRSQVLLILQTVCDASRPGRPRRCRSRFYDEVRPWARAIMTDPHAPHADWNAAHATARSPTIPAHAGGDGDRRRVGGRGHATASGSPGGGFDGAQITPVVSPRRRNSAAVAIPIQASAAEATASSLELIAAGLRARRSAHHVRDVRVGRRRGDRHVGRG